jgi:hypothetical protein
MREKIPVICDDDAFNLMHVVEGAEIAVNTRQSMRIFSKDKMVLLLASNTVLC